MSHVATAEHFASQLNAYRPLTEAEISKLDQLKRQCAGPRRVWTAKEDRDLKRMARKHQATVIAQMTGRTVWSVRSRIRTLKRKERDRG